MTPIEIELAKALAGCTFLPGHPHKRFARQMAAAADNNPGRTLTDRQRRFMCALVQRYRRQIPDQTLVTVAKDMGERSLIGVSGS